VIDPYGRILLSLPLSESAILDTGLPKALPPTFFADYGELILGLMLLLLLGLGFVL
jgi:apolipoprotein N-acyltransferase